MCIWYFDRIMIMYFYTVVFIMLHSCIVKLLGKKLIAAVAIGKKISFKTHNAVYTM